MFPNPTRSEATGAQVAMDDPSSSHRVSKLRPIFTRALGILIPIAVGSYYFQGILNHIIYPAFSDWEHTVATLCLLGAAIAISGVTIYNCRQRGIAAGKRIGIEQEARRCEDLGEMLTLMEELRKKLDDADQK